MKRWVKFIINSLYTTHFVAIIKDRKSLILIWIMKVRIFQLLNTVVKIFTFSRRISMLMCFWIRQKPKYFRSFIQFSSPIAIEDMVSWTITTQYLRFQNDSKFWERNQRPDKFSSHWKGSKIKHLLSSLLHNLDILTCNLCTEHVLKPSLWLVSKLEHSFESESWNFWSLNGILLFSSPNSVDKDVLNPLLC